MSLRDTFIRDMSLPEPFEYKRQGYAYECVNPTCHARIATPRLLNYKSVPVPVCDKCFLNTRMYQARERLGLNEK